MKINRVRELEKLILHHKELYYRGKAEISDESYDKLEIELKKLDPENPVLSLVGHMQIDRDVKAAHAKKMLSLDKTYDQKNLEKWIDKNEALSVFKIDGSSCSLIYRNGHLNLAKTRGDGSIGENITKKAMFIPDIPKAISIKEEIEVRGEIFCIEKNFFELTSEMSELGLERPTSQRNIVAGLLGRKENIHLSSHLSFKAFDLITNDKYKREHEKLDQLKIIGFDIPDYIIHKNNKDLQKRIDEAKEFMSKGDYLIDGLVFVYDDLKLHQELGETSHHPRYKIAFKFAGDTKITKINEIEWGVSRNGVLTPVALVESVELSGAMISRVTLHNFGLVKNYELCAGDEIEIIRSGEVIPKFLGISKKAKNGKFIYPKNCPSCSSTLEIEDIWLYCSNENCPAKVKEQILNYVQKSGIEDVSDKRLDEMLSKGLIETIPDLYKLKQEDFLNLEKVKDKLATKMYENIQKSKEQSLAQFISAIGVEGVSFTKSEKIISQGYNTIEKILELDLESMLKIEGFAERSSQLFLDSLQNKKNLIKQLIKAGIKIKADELSTGEGPLQGLKFCITGELSLPRGDFEKLLKKNGGIMVSSVSKNTSYLITNETDSSSSKFLKAKSLNVPIISEDQLLKMLEG
jgi:DNA ligase (NAD+)